MNLQFLFITACFVVSVFGAGILVGAALASL